MRTFVRKLRAEFKFEWCSLSQPSRVPILLRLNLLAERDAHVRPDVAAVELVPVLLLRLEILGFFLCPEYLPLLRSHSA